MIRRDEFIRKLNNVSSSATLETEITGLEKFIDEELAKEETLIKFTNSVTSGSNGSANSNIEFLTKFVALDSIHRDSTVLDSNTSNEKISEIGNSSISYAKYKEGEVGDPSITLFFPNNTDASQKPWEDVTLANTSLINGSIEIECPSNTNKMVAYKLAEKYMKIDDFDSEGNPTVGFWSRGVKPNNANNKNQSENIEDAVTVRYDSTTNKVYMIFKLF